MSGGANAGCGDADGVAQAVIYEVNLDLDASIAEDYLAWLRPHMREICALPGFLGASLHEVSEPAAEPGRVALCVQYRLRDQSSFDDYQRDHAPRLRADGIARFGGKFNASRRVLRVPAR
ncbi:DUF4286 family protein [Lysobacter sp. CA199]|uniref:DUF4286 family protein n=1 Tax=Lysobacter sp. CA199 TaxID=3455608 RepID=UPI003F8D0257